MAMRSPGRERRPGQQDDSSRKPTRRLPAPDDQDGDESGTDEGIHLSLEEFMAMASQTMSRGDNTAAVARLHRDLAEARRKKNEWKQRYEQIAADVPEDSVVLTGPEADAYRKLLERPNFDFAKAPSLLDALENDKATLTADNLKYRNQSVFDEYAAVSGLNKKAVGGVVEREHLHAELGEVKVEKTDAAGKKTTEPKKTLMVRKASEPKAPLVPFDEYVTKNADWYWPSLRAKDETAAPTNGAAPNGFQPPTRPLAVENGPTSHEQSGNMVATFIKNANAQVAAQGNPLSRGAQPAPQRSRNPAQRT
jgi:hypothetical protein